MKRREVSRICQISDLAIYMVVTFNEKQKRRSLGETLRSLVLDVLTLKNLKEMQSLVQTSVK